MSDEDVAAFCCEQMVALDDRDVVVDISEPLSAGVIAEFEVREVQVDDAGEQSHSLAAAVHVRVPDLRDVDGEILEDVEDVGQVCGGIAADPVDVFRSLVGAHGDTFCELCRVEIITGCCLADVPVLTEDTVEWAA